MYNVCVTNNSFSPLTGVYFFKSFSHPFHLLSSKNRNTTPLFAVTCVYSRKEKAAVKQYKKEVRSSLLSLHLVTSSDSIKKMNT